MLPRPPVQIPLLRRNVREIIEDKPIGVVLKGRKGSLMTAVKEVGGFQEFPLNAESVAKPCF
jgi:hypothetical protein